MKVFDKVFVVTGAGAGIGRHLVLNLLSKGARVAGVDINEAGLAETIKEASTTKEKLSTHVIDLSDHEQVEQLPKAVLDYHGQIDGIINNAGMIQPFVPVHELDYQKIRQVMDVNFYGTLYMTKVFCRTFWNDQQPILLMYRVWGALFLYQVNLFMGHQKQLLSL